jgi:predicted AAA+ superfamily ATPase
LYGPPGTGKSSMVAAMANFLKYDMYDLELSQVSHSVAIDHFIIFLLHLIQHILWATLFSRHYLV